MNSHISLDTLFIVLHLKKFTHCNSGLLKKISRLKNRDYYKSDPISEFILCSKFLRWLKLRYILVFFHLILFLNLLLLTT